MSNLSSSSSSSSYMDLGTTGGRRRSVAVAGFTDAQRAKIAKSSVQRALYSLSKAQKWNDYGAMRVKRGTPDNLAMFGAERSKATAEQLRNRQVLGYTGKGLYRGRGFYKGFGRDLGSGIGTILSGVTGIPGLSNIGGQLGQLGANYTGWGAYGNSTMIGEDPIPSFGSGDQQGDTVITYREYVCDIYGPENTGFGNQVFPLNPGIESTFPFLSQLAQNYEEYQFQQLLFHFRSSIAPIGASGSGQVGEVIMSTNYNPAAEPYTDKQTMLSAALSMSGRVTNNQNHGVECDPRKLSMAVGKYVRSGPIPQDEDLKTYDHGLLNVAVAGIPSEYQNQPVGQIWVAYRVVLRKPKKFTSLGWGISRDVFCQPNASRNGCPFLTTDDPLNANTGLLTGQQNRIGCQLVSGGIGSNVTKIIFPAAYSGTVRIRLMVQPDYRQSAWSSIMFNATLAGNVVPVYDMLSPSSDAVSVPPTQKGNWAWNVVGSPLLSGRTDIQEIHVRVSLSTGGVDNEVILTANAGTVVGGLLHPTWMAQCDVEEYNASFSYRQDGANDRLTLIDSSESIVNV